MTLRKLLGLSTALVGLCGYALFAHAADPVTAGPLTVVHPWSRPTDSMATTGAVYLVVKNTGTTADRLISASTDVAGMAELHTNVNDAGMMRMKHMDEIDVPAQGSATLKPGGIHIMLMDLKGQLKEGATYPLTLRFEKAGSVTIQVQVERTGTREKPMKSGGMEGMHDSMGDMKN